MYKGIVILQFCPKCYKTEIIKRQKKNEMLTLYLQYKSLDQMYLKHIEDMLLCSDFMWKHANKWRYLKKWFEENPRETFLVADDRCLTKFYPLSSSTDTAIAVSAVRTFLSFLPSTSAFWDDTGLTILRRPYTGFVNLGCLLGGDGCGHCPSPWPWL